MNPEEKFKLKAFAWNQFVYPFIVLFNSHNLRLLSLIAAFFFIVVKSPIGLLISFSVICILSVYDIYRDIKSGSYIAEYRKYKYSDYRKAMKDVKNSKSANLINNTNDINTINNTSQHAEEKREN